MNEQSPAKYPITASKRRKSQKKKKPKQGETVQFHAKVNQTFYNKLKSILEEIDLANEGEYPLMNSDFTIK